MNFDDLPPEFGRNIAGAIGSAVALFFMKGTWRTYSVAFLSGIAIAHYLGPVVTDTFPKLGPETSGFLVGTFGVIIVKKLFDTWTEFDAGTLLKEKARRVLGLDKPL